MTGLKPSEEVQIGAITAAGVWAIFQLNTPNLADVKAAPAGNKVVHGSVKTAAWTATAFVAGLSVLGKSPTIFIIGSVVIIAEAWKNYHANATDPSTGKVPASAMTPGS